MKQTWRFIAALVLTCAIRTQCSECRLLQQSVEGAATQYTQESAGGRSCSTICSNPLLFANAFKTQPASYACTVDGVVGFQAGAGSTTCTTASGSQVLNSQDYSCLCLAADSIPGLSKPNASGACSSCPSYAGESGSTVSLGGESLCMATTEMGTTNHFGVVSAPATCSYISGAVAAQTSAFSCVCAYGGSAGSSNASTVPTLPLPQTQAATAG